MPYAPTVEIQIPQDLYILAAILLDQIESTLLDPLEALQAIRSLFYC